MVASILTAAASRRREQIFQVPEEDVRTEPSGAPERVKRSNTKGTSADLRAHPGSACTHGQSELAHPHERQPTHRTDHIVGIWHFTPAAQPSACFCGEDECRRMAKVADRRCAGEWGQGTGTETNVSKAKLKHMLQVEFVNLTKHFLFYARYIWNNLCQLPIINKLFIKHTHLLNNELITLQIHK